MYKKEPSLHEKENLLHDAADKGDFKTVKNLLDQGVDPSAHLDGQGSALILACDSGHLEVAKLLIQYGADIDYYSELGDSPLLCACVSDSEEIVKVLLEAGVNIKPIKTLLGTMSVRIHIENPVILKWLEDYENGAFPVPEILLRSWYDYKDVFSFNKVNGKKKDWVNDADEERIIGKFLESSEERLTLFYKENNRTYYQRGKFKVYVSSPGVKCIYFRIFLWEFFFLFDKNQMKEARIIKSLPAVLKGINDPTYDELDKSCGYFFYNIYKAINNKDDI